MFEIVRVGSSPGQPRLLSPSGLKAGDFEKIAKELAVKPFRAKKTGFVAARESDGRGAHRNALGRQGDREDRKARGFCRDEPDAQKKAVLRDGEGHANTYVIGRAKFGELYERHKGENEFGAIYRAVGTVDAISFPAASTFSRLGASHRSPQAAICCATETRCTGTTRTRSRRRIRRLTRSPSR